MNVKEKFERTPLPNQLPPVQTEEEKKAAERQRAEASKTPPL